VKNVYTLAPLKLINGGNMKIIPRETRQGMIQVTKNMLFTFHDIQEVCIKLGYDNQKMLDELTGFPNGKDKCIGVLDLENKENI
jgi:hypothetical protein